MRCVAGAIFAVALSSSTRKSKSTCFSLCIEGFCATAREIKAKQRIMIFIGGRVLHKSCAFLLLLILSAYFKTELVKMLKIIALFVALFLPSPLTMAASDEWSQFRGP